MGKNYGKNPLGKLLSRALTQLDSKQVRDRRNVGVRLNESGDDGIVMWGYSNVHKSGLLSE